MIIYLKKKSELFTIVFSGICGTINKSMSCRGYGNHLGGKPNG